MTRLEYWIMADTQYRVHSPFVFEMYRKVLFATVGKELRERMCEGLSAEMEEMVRKAKRCERKYHESVYKIRDHYGMKVVSYDEDEAVLENGVDPITGLNVIDTVKVVCRPHRHHARELRWRAQQGNKKYNVSIDMYDVGLLMFCPKMQEQQFLLK